MSQYIQIHPGFNSRLLLASALLTLILISNAEGQTTQFTYQGKLTDASNPATGQYDFQFKLFDSADFVTGNQVGSTVNRFAVQITNGIFTVELDFGAGVFISGAARFLGIGIRPAGSPNAFTVLSPRQSVTSTPYSVRSATAGTAETATNATQLGGLTSSGFIQNTTSQQAATHFNIGGTGTANILNAAMQFNIGGNRILSSAGTNNLFAGVNSGVNNTSGNANAFFGKNSGQANTTGISNSFVGYNAGAGNTTGQHNSFFGDAAGFVNATGNDNSFFGFLAGVNNTASNNSFFGSRAGVFNTTGSLNSFFGNEAGFNNTTGNFNTFLGFGTGQGNTVGNNNTLIGNFANVGSSALTFATAIGAGAIVNTSNTLVLGRNTDTVQIPGTLNTTGPFSASIVNATTQFNLGGSRILSNAGTNNLFVGIGAGASNTTGLSNSFFGASAGQGNTTGGTNSFFGDFTGFNNTTGQSNSFFGRGAGFANTTGSFNSFFGIGAGSINTTGVSNTFIGEAAGVSNQTGANNTFVGRFSGFTFGTLNTTGNNNTLLGAESVVETNISNATAIGYRAQVTQSNSLVLGGITGVNDGTNTNVGIGTTAPNAKLHIIANGGNILLGDPGCGPGSGAIGFGASFSGCGNYALLGGDGSTYINRPAGGTIIFREGNGPNQVEIRPGGSVGIGVLEGGGSTQLCRNGVAAIATCSSSLRYKTDIELFSRGLDLIKRLRPISFTWKQGGMRDLGFGAEDVATIEPLLVTHNAKGEIEGVKYDRITVVLVNSVREQQRQIQQQQQQIEALKKIVCADHPNTELCNLQ